MRKFFVVLQVVLGLYLSYLPAGSAQTLPTEALTAVHRIQVVAVSDDKSLQSAEAFAKDFSAAFDLRAYIIHKNGWYKVLLGDFATKADLRSDLKQVKRKAKDAWPVAADNEAIVAVWDHGKRLDFSQSRLDAAPTLMPEIPRQRAIQEEPRRDAEAERAQIEVPEQKNGAKEQMVEIFATPTPLPGVIEVDLLATPSKSADEILELNAPDIGENPIVRSSADEQPLVDQAEALEVIIPTPAPIISLTLPDLSADPDQPSESANDSAIPEVSLEPDDDSVLPEISLGEDISEKPKVPLERVDDDPAPPASQTEDGADELVIDIDDLKLDEVLGTPKSDGALPFIIPGADKDVAEHSDDRQNLASSPALPGQAAEPVLVKISLNDSSLLAVGFADGQLELWDLATNTLHFRNAAHSGRICDVSFAFKKDHLSSVSVDGSMKAWTLNDGTELQSLRLDLPDLRDVKFDHAKARLLVLHQNRLTAFNPSNGQTRQIFPAGEFLQNGEQPLGERDRLACPPDAGSVLAFDRECCAPVLFQQLAGGIELALPELFSTPLRAAAFSPNAQFFAIARGKTVDLEGENAGVEIYQFLPSGKKQAVSVEFLLKVEAGRDLKVSSLLFSPKSSVLLVGYENGLLQMFQLFSRIPSGKDSTPELSARAGKVLRSFEGHTANVSGLAFFPDGNRFVSVSHDGTLRIWEVKSGKEIQQLSLF